MSEKLRSVNTKFWDDPFVEGMNPSEKLLFLYLLTNPLTNLLGIYEITIKRISYDTGLSKDTISKGFESFGKARKAYYTPDNFIILPNWLKNQRLNTNMKIAVAREFNNLPNNIKNSILTNGLERLGNDSEGFRMVMESLGKYEIEIESEIEVESKIEKSWRNDFQIYLSECKKAYKEFWENEELIKTQQHLNPGINVKLSIEKGYTNFWGTELGWKNKKKCRSNEIDWKATIINSIGLNKVYLQKQFSDPIVSRKYLKDE